MGGYQRRGLFFFFFLWFFLGWAGQSRGWGPSSTSRLGGGELGHGLGPLGDGVLGELAGEDEADGGLDLPGGEGALLGVAGEAGGLGRDLLEDVVREGVHDGHGLGGDAGVGVHLLEHLVDVDLVGLGPLLLAATLSALGALLGGHGWRVWWGGRRRWSLSAFSH